MKAVSPPSWLQPYPTALPTVRPLGCAAASAGGTTATYPTVPKVGDVESVVYGQDTRGSGPIFPGRFPGRGTYQTHSHHQHASSETEFPELKGKCHTFKMDGFFDTFFFFNSDFIKL